MNKFKIYKMYAVWGKSYGLCALAHSRWKATEIQKNLFNIGDNPPTVVPVEVKFPDYEKPNKRLLQKELAELRERIENIEALLVI